MEELADLVFFLENSGKDPTSMIFDDELTGLRNRRFIKNHLEFRVQWGDLKARPTSMVFVDIDNLDQINDALGRDLGTAVLKHLAELVKQAAPEGSTPVRYGADEFVILLPEEPKKTAVTIGRKLISAVHGAPYISEDATLEIPFTISVSITTAPEDAESDKTFVERALTALKMAKDLGGDRAINAAEISPENEAAESMLHKDAAKNAGRKSQLAQVSQALKRFGKRESQLVLVEGGPGMGKTSFLDTINTQLSKTKVARIRLAGVTQELFRPYYLVSNLVQELLYRRKDKGGEILANLDPVALCALSSAFVPSGDMRIHTRQAADVDLGDETQKREHVFNAMASIIPKLIENKPLIVLVDDLHLVDEASLLIFKHLIAQKSLPLFLCGSGPDALQADGEHGPLWRFVQSVIEMAPLETIHLTPLSPQEIEAHFNKLYPGVRLPEQLCEDIAQVSQGNPLFFNGIMFKLVFDEKIRRADGHWVVDPIEEDYLPRSMDEIISQKVASLDQESQALLDRASAFGDAVTLSLLTGSSEMDEAAVLDFLDNAAAQGLVSATFHMNDENIRFLGNQVRQVIYGKIGQEEKERLHENIGDYQEELYKKRLMPSPAILAYHYQRSANLEKAKLYEQIQAQQNEMIFNPDEAESYSGRTPEWDDDAQAPDQPLAPEHYPLAAKVIRALLIAIRNTKLYPTGSDLTANAVNKFKEVLETVLVHTPRLTIVLEKDVIYANGDALDIPEIKTVSEAFSGFMGTMDLKSIAFSHGATLAELVRLVEGISEVDPKNIHKRFWKEFSTENRLRRVQVKQVTYTQVSGEEQQTSGASSKETELGSEEQVLAAKVVKTLLSSASKLKLYPASGPVAQESIEEVMKILKVFLDKHEVMTLAGVDQSLLLNGNKVDARVFDKLTPFMLKFLESACLKSVTFYQKASKQELTVFLANVGKQPQDGTADEFWANVGMENKLSTIYFNISVYDVLADQIALQAAGEGQGGQEEEEEVEEPLELESDEGDLEMPPESEEQDISLEPSVENIRDLFLKGNEKGVARVLEVLFYKYSENEEGRREQVLETCRELLNAPELSPEPRFAPLLVDPLLAVLPAESDAQLLENMASLLYDTAANFVRIGEYSLATWIFGHFARRREAMEMEDPEGIIPEALTRQPEGDMALTLMADVASGEGFRQQSAFALMGGMGDSGVRLLLNIIKDNDDVRTRQIAASQLEKIGYQAVEKLKQELVNENSGKRKARIVEVIDTATTDLKTELTFLLADSNTSVRKAGFALAERLNAPYVVNILSNLLDDERPEIAKEAVVCLGKTAAPGSAGIIVKQMDVNKAPELLEACCQALGRLADPEAIVPLSKILSYKKTLFSKKEYAASVRAAAAFALAGIPHKLAKGALAAYADDPEPRVREAAQKVMGVSQD
ncbi:diguanylate cyclase [Desulfatibacillum aliphaticivorans]|uniref:diguanylate cyclase n=1 Tax=Desulfatibacillum aliphaticivorans TaxID=218208 RepID=UPI00041BF5F9|nr:diguanylate cyclase [Desulfatibacillum aliphaticivorans]